MPKRPAHLTYENASNFKDAKLVAVYQHRLPYPQAVFDTLLTLIRDDKRIVLDVGTGIGNLARRLAPHVTHVDAIDFSQAMIDTGKTLLDDDAPNLNWICGRVEDAIPDKKYSLIIGGDSMHWMDWDVIFPMFAEHLAIDASVALVRREDQQPIWHNDIMGLVKKYSVYQNFEPYNFLQLIQEQGYFEVHDDIYTEYVTYQQSVDEYIGSWHSRGSLAPDKMPPDHLQKFDDGIRKIVMPHLHNDKLLLSTRGHITVGKPLRL